MNGIDNHTYTTVRPSIAAEYDEARAVYTTIAVLRDDTIERIARRVVELMEEKDDPDVHN